jgi:hypothetical protein
VGGKREKNGGRGKMEKRAIPSFQYVGWWKRENIVYSVIGKESYSIFTLMPER